MIRKPIIKRKKTRTTPSITLSSPEQHPPDPLVPRISSKNIMTGLVGTRLKYKRSFIARQHEPDEFATPSMKESHKDVVINPTKPARRSTLKQHGPDPLVPRISRKHLDGTAGRSIRTKK